jgi:hypothetical protein
VFAIFEARVGCLRLKNKTGVCRGRHVHSTLTTLQTPVYKSAPMEIRTPVLALKGPRPGPLDNGGLS